MSEQPVPLTEADIRVLQAKLDAYKRYWTASCTLLQRLGWYSFGWHANVNPCPPLEFSDVYGVENDEDGLPYFEKVRVE